MNIEFQMKLFKEHRHFLNACKVLIFSVNVPQMYLSVFSAGSLFFLKQFLLQIGRTEHDSVHSGISETCISTKEIFQRINLNFGQSQFQRYYMTNLNN